MPTNESGNIFIANAAGDRAPTGARGELRVQVDWVSNDQVRITYPVNARLFRSANAQGRIRIEYRGDSGDRPAATTGAAGATHP